MSKTTKTAPGLEVSVQVRWWPHVVSKDGLLKTPMQRDYGAEYPLFDYGFESVEAFTEFLRNEPATDRWLDKYTDDYVLLPVVTRRVSEKP